MTDRVSTLAFEQPTLFVAEAPDAAVTALGPRRRRAAAGAKHGARVRTPRRDQQVWARIDLDAAVAEDDPVRSIWALLQGMDLSALYVPIEARDEIAGAPAIDPALLLALWIYATSEGEGSARELARLTEVHASYRWLCGGVAVGYHTLSDFRSRRGDDAGALLTQVLAMLMQQGLVDLHSVAQDGTRVRASAGASSFRRTATLATLMQEARAHLDAVTRAAADPAISARRAAARCRGAADRLARIEAALAQVAEVEATKQRSRAKDPTVRVSTTDPDARVMKMGDGGFRPAFNLQFATTTDAARVIVGVTAINRGSDMGQSTPMLAQVVARTGVCPQHAR